ncbi:unnamed protein product, partial [Bemisia tabaci]
GKDGIASSDNTSDTFTASLRGQLGHFLNDVSRSSDNAFAGDAPGFGNMAGPSEQGMEEVNYLDVTSMSESFNSMTWTSCLQDPLNPETAQSYSEKLGKHLAAADDGQIVLKYYSDHGTLSDHCRSKLCDIIIREEFKNSDRYKIDSRVFGIASKAICLLFPGEVPEIYYIPYENLGYKRKVNAKGKLVEKYNNRRSSLRAVGLLPPVKRQKASSQDAPVALSDEAPGENIEYGEDISWLQENGERGALEVFNAKWKATYPIRRRMILSSSSAKVYLDKFSVFKNPIRATQLMLEDFKTQYPAEANNFFPSWAYVSRKIFDAAERKADADRTWRYSILKHGIDLHRIKYSGNISISAFKILLFLLPQPGFAKKYWRPSRMESYESIFLEVDSSKSYKEMLSRRKEKLSAVGLRVQPLVVVLKKDDGGVSIFVTIDDYELKCSNVLDAFDLCFKLIHVLNLDYPAEAQSAYLFIQKYCYKIQPKEPRILPSVAALAASLGL